MKWFAQVVHVARKDVRHLGWLLLAYLAAVAALTGFVVLGGFGAPSQWLVGTLLLVLLGMILVAVLIQSDSPARSDAFWVALPLDRSAVLAAKVLVAAVALVAPALAGQAAGLLAHDVAAAQLSALLGESVLSYGIWLVVAAVAAALTPDLRSFVVALVVTALVVVFPIQLVIHLVAPVDPTASEPNPTLFGLVVVVGGTLLVAHQYGTRNVRRGRWLAALLGLLALVALPATSRAGGGPGADAASAPEAGEVTSELRPAKLAVARVVPRGGSSVVLELRAEGFSPRHRYSLALDPTIVHLPNGARMEIPLPESYGVSSWSGTDPLPDLRWLPASALQSEFTVAVPLELPRGVFDAVRRGDARLTVRGRMEVLEPRAVAELPLAEGAAASGAGRRARIIRVDGGGHAPRVEIHTTTVESSRAARARQGLLRGGWPPAPQVALVNRDRGEALALREGTGRGGDFGLVLPGPHAMSYTAEHLAELPGSRNPDVDERWLTAAQVVLIEWVSIGSYPVAVEGYDLVSVTGGTNAGAR